MGSQLISRAAATASLLVSSAVFLPTMGQAQAIVRGVLYNDVTGLPVRGTVMLVDPATDAAVMHAVTDTLGQFALKIGDGTYRLAAVTAGYTSVLSAPIPLQDGEAMTLRVPIRQDGDPEHHIAVTEHVRPEPSRVRTMQARTALAQGNFEGRKAVGTGLHYDRANFARTSASTLGAFLQSVPGLQVVDPNSTASMQMSRNLGMGGLSMRGPAVTTCHVGWFVDGHRIDLPGRSDPLTDGLGSMQMETIEAVEVFRGISEMPPEFAAPDLRCGAIAVWTRRP